MKTPVNPVRMKFLGWRRLLLSVSIATAGIVAFSCLWAIPAWGLSLSIDTAIGFVTFIFHASCLVGGMIIGSLVSDRYPIWQMTCSYCGNTYELDSACETCKY